jgi:mutator protein MutT
MAADAEFCYECGALSPVIDGFPVCPRHGPRWKLRRNAPCADVAIERDGRVLMVRRGFDPYVGCWEFPGGYMEFGETPAAGARREIREELGVEVRLTGLLGVFVHEWQADDFVQVHAFVGTIEGEPMLDGVEVVDFAWFAPDKFPTGSALSPGHAERLDAWCSGRRGPLLPGMGV